MIGSISSELKRLLKQETDLFAILQICQREQQLFENLFPGSDLGSGALSPLIDTLATMLYDTLRPAFIQLQDLAALCQLVHILQQEVSCSSHRLRHHSCSKEESHVTLISHNL